MPYRSEHIRLPRHLKKTVKLTPEDRMLIHEMYKQGTTIHGIARAFAGTCSRRMIQLILFPERYAIIRKRSKDAKYHLIKTDETREKRRIAMRKHRAYKHKLFLEGKIK